MQSKSCEPGSNAFKQRSITCFNNFIKTLEKWFDDITNFFIQRETSGFVEGFNNKIKVLKRRCYGIFNIQHLYQRIFLDLEGTVCSLDTPRCG